MTNEKTLKNKVGIWCRPDQAERMMKKKVHYRQAMHEVLDMLLDNHDNYLKKKELIK